MSEDDHVEVRMPVWRMVDRILFSDHKNARLKRSVFAVVMISANGFSPGGGVNDNFVLLSMYGERSV
jgi:hypothetical protein